MEIDRWLVNISCYVGDTIGAFKGGHMLMSQVLCSMKIPYLGQKRQKGCNDSHCVIQKLARKMVRWPSLIRGPI